MYSLARLFTDLLVWSLEFGAWSLVPGVQTSPAKQALRLENKYHFLYYMIFRAPLASPPARPSS